MPAALLSDDKHKLNNCDGLLHSEPTDQIIKCNNNTQPTDLITESNNNILLLSIHEESGETFGLVTDQATKYVISRGRVLESSRVLGSSSVTQAGSFGITSNITMADLVDITSNETRSNIVGTTSYVTQADSPSTTLNVTQADSFSTMSNVTQADSLGTTSNVTIAISLVSMENLTQADSLGTASNITQEDSLGTTLNVAQADSLGTMFPATQTFSLSTMSKVVQADSLGTMFPAIQTFSLGTMSNVAQADNLGTMFPATQTFSFGTMSNVVQADNLDAMFPAIETFSLGTMSKVAQADSLGAMFSATQTDTSGTSTYVMQAHNLPSTTLAVNCPLNSLVRNSEISPFIPGNMDCLQESKFYQYGCLSKCSNVSIPVTDYTELFQVGKASDDKTAMDVLQLSQISTVTSAEVTLQPCKISTVNSDIATGEHVKTAENFLLDVQHKTLTNPYVDHSEGEILQSGKLAAYLDKLNNSILSGCMTAVTPSDDINYSNQSLSMTAVTPSDDINYSNQSCSMTAVTSSYDINYSNQSCSITAVTPSNDINYSIQSCSMTAVTSSDDINYSNQSCSMTAVTPSNDINYPSQISMKTLSPSDDINKCSQSCRITPAASLDAISYSYQLLNYVDNFAHVVWSILLDHSYCQDNSSDSIKTKIFEWQLSNLNSLFDSNIAFKICFLEYLGVNFLLKSTKVVDCFDLDACLKILQSCCDGKFSLNGDKMKVDWMRNCIRSLFSYLFDNSNVTRIKWTRPSNWPNHIPFGDPHNKWINNCGVKYRPLKDDLRDMYVFLVEVLLQKICYFYNIRVNNFINNLTSTAGNGIVMQDSISGKGTNHCINDKGTNHFTCDKKSSHTFWNKVDDGSNDITLILTQSTCGPMKTICLTKKLDESHICNLSNSSSNSMSENDNYELSLSNFKEILSVLENMSHDEMIQFSKDILHETDNTSLSHEIACNLSDDVMKNMNTDHMIKNINTTTSLMHDSLSSDCNIKLENPHVLLDVKQNSNLVNLDAHQIQAAVFVNLNGSANHVCMPNAQSGHRPIAVRQNSEEEMEFLDSFDISFCSSTEDCNISGTTFQYHVPSKPSAPSVLVSGSRSAGSSSGCNFLLEVADSRAIATSVDYRSSSSMINMQANNTVRLDNTMANESFVDVNVDVDMLDLNEFI